jgi:hypothetical protein
MLAKDTSSVMYFVQDHRDAWGNGGIGHHHVSSTLMTSRF